MLWRNFKRCGGKKDVLMVLFIRHCDLEIQVGFCHFFCFIYQVIWLACSFVVYGVGVISDV